MTMVLKLDDKVKIEGESILKGYEKQIDVAYLDHGMSMPMVGDKSSNSRTSGRCAHKDLRGADMRSALLIQSNLMNANLGGADAREASFAQSLLSGTDLTQCRMTNSDLSEAYLQRACFQDTDLTGSDFSHASLCGCDLSTARLTGVRFDQADLHAVAWPAAGPPHPSTAGRGTDPRLLSAERYRPARP